MFKTTANKITMLRVVLIPLFLYFVYTGKVYAGFGTYCVACISDFLDGYIARHYNQVSNFGKFADPLADKMLVLAAMCYFIENGQMAGWMVAIVLFREFAVSGLRLIAAGEGLIIAAAKSGKIKTFCTMIGLGIMLLFGQFRMVNTIVSVIIVVTTIWSGIEYFYVNRDVLKS